MIRGSVWSNAAMFAGVKTYQAELFSKSVEESKRWTELHSVRGKVFRDMDEVFPTIRSETRSSVVVRGTWIEGRENYLAGTSAVSGRLTAPRGLRPRVFTRIQSSVP